MGRACSIHGLEEEYIQNCGGEARRKEVILKA
jgi:hypothetical protein